MSDNNNRHRHSKSYGKSFIILPIIFFIGIYLVAYLAFAPALSTVVAVAGMLFSDVEKDYSTEYNNIFVPVAENTNVSAVSTNDETYIDDSTIQFPRYGEQFGEILVEDCSIESKLFFGDGDIALRNGVGVYNGSSIPGYGSTILVAGHNNTYFNGLKNAVAGQKVEIKTSYGNYAYEITKTDVKKFNDKTAYDLSANTENLIMYTCYPFDELGLTAQRFFVYAKYVSGPHVNTSTEGGE